jgi:hypothetical protein
VVDLAEAVADRPSSPTPSICAPPSGQGGEHVDRNDVPWALLLILLCAVPLLWPAVPPLVDYPGHLARLRVALDLSHSADLQRFFGFEWKLIGNIGTDLLIVGIGKLIGLEPAAKLVTVLIPTLTGAGLVWLSYEIHGRLLPTVAAALPFAYAMPLQFGFLNYSLGFALALLGVALWLRLADRPRWRGLLFVPLSFLAWVTHVTGWGLLGLMVAGAEWARAREHGRGNLAALVTSARSCLVMAGPLFPMLAWSGSVSGETSLFFEWNGKLMALAYVLRDRWLPLDIGSVAFVWALLGLTAASPRLTFDRLGAAIAVPVAAAFLLLPRYLSSVAYTDIRIAPAMLAVAVLAIRPRNPADRSGFVQMVGVLCVAFFLLRTMLTTASFASYAEDQQSKLQALSVIPKGSAVLSLIGAECDGYGMWRNGHLGSFVTVRREGWSNNYWTLPASTLLKMRKNAGSFQFNPSQIVVAPSCSLDNLTANEALQQFPRGLFGYVWLIDVPTYDAGNIGRAELVWSRPGSTVYRLR